MGRPWRAICEGLAAEEVEFVFGLPGNPELLYNDLADFPQIYIPTVIDDLRQTAHARVDDRRAARHRFHCRHPETLLGGGQQEQISR